MILFKYPSRGRPALFKSTFEKWRDMLSGKHEVQWLVSLDTNDHTMNNTNIRSFLDAQKNVIYCYGDSTNKVSAINANMDCVKDLDYSTLILISDDMTPEVQGYDDVIVSKMQEFYSDHDGALHFNDGRVGSSLCTLSIMGKKLYEKFGYIYHPDYCSLWCDNEFHEVCHLWGKMTYIDQVIIKHAWIDVTGHDNLHTRNESFYQRDKTMFENRKKAGFPSHSVKPTELPKPINHIPRRGRIIDRRRV